MLATVRHVLQAAHVRFDGVAGKVSGFYPGSPYHYPGQPVPFYLYARDTATIQPAARYLYDDATLRTAVEEFLAMQYGPNTLSHDGDLGTVHGAGAISATVSPGRIVNKATVVADEETSLIRAAYVYYATAGGAEWLSKPIIGRRVVDRLNAAMDWLVGKRLHPDLGVFIRGNTTDWGDVKQEPGEATDIGPADGWTYSTYDQALAFSALMELSEMNRAAGQAAAASRYLEAAQVLQRRATALLWMPDRGYFRIHGHLVPHPHDGFEEDEIVAIGNAAALYYGLATEQQAGPIVRALERARQDAGAHKPGLTLHPPYPASGFSNVAMAWRAYQNGAIWDWWGGRQVLGEFRYGYASRASEHLWQVAQDWARHPGKVYEWESPWLGRVSDDYRYAGAAAVMGEAIIEGLFGVSINRGGVALEPRLGTRDGSIRAYQPASDTCAAYRYQLRDQTGAIELAFGSNTHQRIGVRVLLPSRAAGWSATLNGQPVPVQMSQVGDDTYAAVEAPRGEHVLILTPPRPSVLPLPLPDQAEVPPSEHANAQQSADVDASAGPPAGADPGDVRVGEEPVPEPLGPVPAPGRRYVVQQGDELKEIAERFGVSVASILAINVVPNPDSLTVGQELLIPPER
jgi:LysM repeat protein